MSTMLISPNQSPGPSTATRASTLRLLRFSTSTSPLITTNMALASSPSRNNVEPAGGVSTVSNVDRYSSTSSLSAPKSPMFRSSAGPTGFCESLLINPLHYYGSVHSSKYSGGRLAQNAAMWSRDSTEMAVKATPIPGGASSVAARVQRTTPSALTTWPSGSTKLS